jgi:hypothetical protein
MGTADNMGNVNNRIDDAVDDDDNGPVGGRAIFYWYMYE